MNDLLAVMLLICGATVFICLGSFGCALVRQKLLGEYMLRDEYGFAIFMCLCGATALIAIAVNLVVRK